jgi:hypothetical protein
MHLKSYLTEEKTITVCSHVSEMGAIWERQICYIEAHVVLKLKSVSSRGI